ncbi:prepilin-type N-terminal cleavage/methylation domain-containing protein [Xanthobacter sp. AM11]|uniref:prepilin-type N-terminal cleavage/methylation domain-containing protein n=1 Tax=Xanthobacter sp. AM11 TaxID=3380643 RepID=UPI0039BF0391
MASPEPARCGQSGFTLVEVLVALAVAAAALGSIAALAGSNARASRVLERRVALLATAQAVETGIPGRDRLAPGRTDGDLAGYRWRMDVRGLAVDGMPRGGRWVPRDVLIRVRSPGGEMVVLQTVRLVRSAAE